MKKVLRVLSLFLFAAVLCLGPVNALAEGSILYQGNAKGFVFEPGSRESPTDLFVEFHGVMPGDRLTDTVLIKNEASREVKVRLYLRALGAQEGTEAFLSELKLTVAQEGDSVLFAAPADETAGLSDWVCLGTVYSGGEIPLTITLDVPVTLDNRFKDLIGYLDWEIMAEELPISPDDPEPPFTGDNSGKYLTLMLVSLCGVVLTAASMRKKKKQREEQVL